MLINVPQYIDIEDKIVGPLTAKQLGWLIAMGVILIVMWNMLPGPLFFLIGLPIALIFLALAFFKPYGVPLGNFIIFGIMYFFHPKLYFWKRTPQREAPSMHKKNEIASVSAKKELSSEELRELARLVDSEGAQYSTDLEEILKKAPVKK